MNTKLALSLNNEIIDKAKIYAKNHEISLSKMIESYLDSLTTNKNKEITITPLVESLSGVVNLPDDFDYRKEYRGHLINKYESINIK